MKNKILKKLGISTCLLSMILSSSVLANESINNDFINHSEMKIEEFYNENSDELEVPIELIANKITIIDINDIQINEDNPTFYSDISLPQARLKNGEAVSWRAYIPANTFVQFKVVVAGGASERLQVTYAGENSHQDRGWLENGGEVFYKSYLINIKEQGFYNFSVLNVSAGEIGVSGSLSY